MTGEVDKNTESMAMQNAHFRFFDARSICKREGDEGGFAKGSPSTTPIDGRI